jgi:hypothetical protein
MPSVFRPMAYRTIEVSFPRLVGRKWSIKSPYNDEYKCIAWAACCTAHHWWPDPSAYWPPGVPLEETVDAFIQAFRTLGYEPCGRPDFEFGFQKVAIYTGSDGMVRHMARQHFLGRGWLSKAGQLEDILHPDLASIEGNPLPGSYEYGEVNQILKRSWLRIMQRPCECSRLRCPINALRFWLYRMFHDYAR